METLQITFDGGDVFLGSLRVGSYKIDGMNSRGSADIYGCFCTLPGGRNNLGRYSTKMECEAILKKAIELFIRRITTPKMQKNN